jgi:hypothetical protein
MRLTTTRNAGLDCVCKTPENMLNDSWTLKKLVKQRQTGNFALSGVFLLGYAGVLGAMKWRNKAWSCISDAFSHEAGFHGISN